MVAEAVVAEMESVGRPERMPSLEMSWRNHFLKDWRFVAGAGTLQEMMVFET